MNIPNDPSDAILAKKIAHGLPHFERLQDRELWTALAIIEHLVSRELALECLGGFEPPAQPRFLDSIRTLYLADYLFLLRHTPGFPVLADRLRRRDTRAPFYDARIASRFHRAGYEVWIREEIGVRKEDFDFHAIKGGQAINIEVTALTNESFSPKNVLNVLRGKRKQLPDTHAAGLYCIIPATWADQLPTLQIHFALRNVTFEFFRQSRGLNFVNYSWNPIIEIDEVRLATEINFPVINKPARIPWHDPSVLNTPPAIPPELHRVALQRDDDAIKAFLTTQRNYLSFTDFADRYAR